MLYVQAARSYNFHEGPCNPPFAHPINYLPDQPFLGTDMTPYFHGPFSEAMFTPSLWGDLDGTQCFLECHDLSGTGYNFVFGPQDPSVPPSLSYDRSHIPVSGGGLSSSAQGSPSSDAPTHDYLYPGMPATYADSSSSSSLNHEWYVNLYLLRPSVLSNLARFCSLQPIHRNVLL